MRKFNIKAQIHKLYTLTTVGYSEGDRMRTQLTEKVVQGDDSEVVNQVIRCKSD